MTTFNTCGCGFPALRHKIEPQPAEPVIIKTLQGIGYMLQAEPAAAGGTNEKGLRAATPFSHGWFFHQWRWP